MDSERFAVLSSYGFRQNGQISYGSWNNYAAAVYKYLVNTCYVSLAVRMDRVTSDVKKTIKQTLKQAGKKYRLARLDKQTALFTAAFGKNDDLAQELPACLNLLTGTLRAAGIGPADTCFKSGQPYPDSLCLVAIGQYASCQPVRAAALREESAKVQQKTEENENNGSYLFGLIGAILGMLVGVAVNILVISTVERIYAVLFALIPFAAMFGYKLFKGKLNKASLVIVVVLCLVALVLMPFAQTVLGVQQAVKKESGRTLPLGDAIDVARKVVAQKGFLKEISGDLVKYVIFMALGLLIAWNYIRRQTNVAQLGAEKALLDTLCPNPMYSGGQQTSAQTESVPTEQT